MERKHLSTRLLSYLLTFAMLLSFAVPVGAAGGGESQVSFTQVDNSAVSASLQEQAVEEPEANPVMRPPIWSAFPFFWSSLPPWKLATPPPALPTMGRR